MKCSRPSANASRNQPVVPPRSTHSPSRSWTSATPARGRLRRRSLSRRDSRLSPFDPRLALAYLICRLANRFRPHPRPALPAHDIMGTLLVTNHSPGCHTRFSLYSITGLATWYIEGGFPRGLFWLGLFTFLFLSPIGFSASLLKGGIVVRLWYQSILNNYFKKGTCPLVSI